MSHLLVGTLMPHVYSNMLSAEYFPPYSFCVQFIFRIVTAAIIIKVLKVTENQSKAGTDAHSCAYFTSC